MRLPPFGHVRFALFGCDKLRLAANARRVLCAMSDAPKSLNDAEDVMAQPLALLKATQRPSLHVMHDLPWLPAHDRRDALIVQTLLRQLLPATDQRLEGETVRALAFSAYTAARIQPSEGDASAAHASLAEWLEQEDLSTVLSS